jgi:hypothetical protein
MAIARLTPPPASLEQAPLPLFFFPLDELPRPQPLPASPATLYAARVYQHVNAVREDMEDSDAWRLIATSIVERLLDRFLE